MSKNVKNIEKQENKKTIKSVNLQIIDTKNMIIELLNQAPIPITVKQMIINEVKLAVDETTRQTIANDINKYSEELNKTGANKKEGEE